MSARGDYARLVEISNQTVLGLRAELKGARFLQEAERNRGDYFKKKLRAAQKREKRIRALSVEFRKPAADLHAAVLANSVLRILDGAEPKETS